MADISNLSMQQIVERACAAYAVKDMASLKQTAPWKEAVARIGDERITLKSGIRFQKQKGEVLGFYLWQDPFTKKNEATQEREVKNERAVVLLENGSIVGYYSEPGKRNLDGAAFLTRVAVDGAEVKTDIYADEDATDKVTISFPKGSVLATKDHSADIPDLPLVNTIAKLNRLQEGKKARGVINFSTKECYDNALTTLQITKPTYWPAGQYNESLSMQAKDSTGILIEVIADPQRVFAETGLPSDKDTLEGTLKDELLIASGELTLADRKALSSFKKPEERAAIEASIATLENAGVFSVYKSGKHGQLLGVVLNGWLGADGKTQVTHFEVGGLTCFDLRQEPNKQEDGTKKPEWILYVSRASQSRPPKLDTVVRTGSTEQYGDWVMNEHGAAIFPRLAKGVVDENDPFLMALKAA